MLQALSGGKIDRDFAIEHARHAVKKSGTSFAAGMAILPKKRRQAMHAIYAFCREVDDIADDDEVSCERRRELLDDWRTEITNVFAGQAQTPIGVALEHAIGNFDLPQQEFMMMIEGMEIDANGPVIGPSWSELLTYTRRVAGSVGLLSMPAFGAPAGAASDRFALALGDALQLTNILRDVGEDAQIGRIYLPRELLEKYNVPCDPATLVSATGLADVARDVAKIADEKFMDARAELKNFDWRTVRPALLMMGVYEAYLKKMKARGWQKTGHSLSMSKVEKLLVCVRYGVLPPSTGAHQ